VRTAADSVAGSFDPREGGERDVRLITNVPPGGDAARKRDELERVPGGRIRRLITGRPMCESVSVIPMAGEG